MEIRFSFGPEGFIVEGDQFAEDRPEPRPGWPEPLRKPDHSIEAWWAPEHDALIRSLIELYKWWWYWEAPRAVLAMTDPEVLSAWRVHVNRENRIMYFAQDRALRLGLYDELLGDARTVSCARCGSSLLECDGRGPDLGYRVDICNDCIRDCIWAPKLDNRAGRRAVAEWVHTLAEIAGRVPPAGYGSRATVLAPLSTAERVRLLDHLSARPSDALVKRRFGSWLNALIEAGVLPDGTRRTARGTQTIARDGHVCYSLGERTIDDFLTTNGIAHEREPAYPTGGFRGDFLVHGAIVEYFGLRGDGEYDKKTDLKRAICVAAGVPLIEIFAEDVADDSRLRRKFHLA